MSTIMSMLIPQIKRRLDMGGFFVEGAALLASGTTLELTRHYQTRKEAEQAIPDVMSRLTAAAKDL